MSSSPTFTTTSLLAAVGAALERNGYRPVKAEQAGDWPWPAARVYEDPYSVVAAVAFETWTELSTTWLEAQAALVELISNYFKGDEAKAWEGYLVLLTPSILPREAHAELVEIRSNTSHVRKLVATGDELRGVGDVERALLPLLPLPAEAAVAGGRSALDPLPDLLSRRGIPEQSVRAVIEAFVEQQPMVESLHALLQEEQGG